LACDYLDHGDLWSDSVLGDRRRRVGDRLFCCVNRLVYRFVCWFYRRGRDRSSGRQRNRPKLNARKAFSSNGGTDASGDQEDQERPTHT
jgi:hypothetical protein